MTASFRARLFLFTGAYFSAIILLNLIHRYYGIVSEIPMIEFDEYKVKLTGIKPRLDDLAGFVES